jgi:hypothetical protein
MTAALRFSPGTCNSDNFCTKWARDYQEGKTELNIDQMDSSFSVQQYLQLIIQADPANVERILDMPPGQDGLVWQYEQLRFICLHLNGMVIALQSVCDKQTCVEMKALFVRISLGTTKLLCD